jgi:leucyl aminopeptidase
MEIKAVAANLSGVKSGALLVSHFENGEPLEGDAGVLDKLLGGAIARLVSLKEIKGKLGEATIIHTAGKLAAERIVVIGMGKKKELNLDKIRRATAEACRLLRRKGVETIASSAFGAGINEISLEDAAQAMAEGAWLGLYLFQQHITKPTDYGEVKELSIVENDIFKVPYVEKGISSGKIFAEAANLARDMVNEPANYMTPTDMANTAVKVATTHGLEITILEKEQMKELGMGGLLGVNQGSVQPPKLIVLNYTGNKSAATELTLVGKGLTFDSGGISIKPSERMSEMKGDMAGGASVIAALGAIAQFKPGINVRAIVPATENMPSGSAYKPGDVLTAMNGKTIEVISTDAEGRLILADALSYAGKLGTRRIVDIATLTGACMVALGTICSGAFTNNQELVDKVIAAGERAGEHIWQLPMYEEYKEQNKSDVADIQNTGGRYAGAITAAQFLAEFVGDTPWVHLDIAGTFMSDKEQGYNIKGATGVPVRTLIYLVMNLSGQERKGI